MAVVEAMAAALPVVATAVGGVPEVVVDGASGLLVAADDVLAMRARLAALCQDRPQARRLGERGRADAWRSFSLRRMAREYSDIYGGGD